VDVTPDVAQRPDASFVNTPTAFFSAPAGNPNVQVLAHGLFKLDVSIDQAN